MEVTRGSERTVQIECRRMSEPCSLLPQTPILGCGELPGNMGRIWGIGPQPTRMSIIPHVSASTRSSQT